MKLDKEQDREMLLGLIQNATIQGAAVMVIADLVQRIQGAKVEDEPSARVESVTKPKASS